MKQLYFFIIPLLLQSCSSMYIPSNGSIPLLEKKGEFQGEASAGTNSIYANAAYAFTDHIAAAVSGNLSYKNFSSQYDWFSGTVSTWDNEINSNLLGKFAHRYAEASMGAINVRRSEMPENLTLEIFGGIGMGRATDDRSRYYGRDYFTDMDYACDYYSFFAQGNFGVKMQFLEAGLSGRLAYSRFSYVADDGEEFLFQTNFGALHIIPMGVVRVGGEHVKFVFCSGTHLALTNHPIEHRFIQGFNGKGRLDYTKLHISMGASFRIGGKTGTSK